MCVVFRRYKDVSSKNPASGVNPRRAAAWARRQGVFLLVTSSLHKQRKVTRSPQGSESSRFGFGFGFGFGNQQSAISNQQSAIIFTATAKAKAPLIRPPGTFSHKREKGRVMQAGERTLPAFAGPALQAPRLYGRRPSVPRERERREQVRNMARTRRPSLPPPINHETFHRQHHKPRTAILSDGGVSSAMRRRQRTQALSSTRKTTGIRRMSLGKR